MVNSYILEDRINEIFLLEGFENVAVRIPSFNEILQMATAKFITFLVAITVILLFVIIIGGLNWKPVSLISLVLSSFIIIIIISLLQAYCISTASEITFGVIEAELENVSFHDSSFIGINEHNEVIKIKSDIVLVSYVKIFRAYENMTRPMLKIYFKPEELDQLLRETKTYLNLTNVTFYENGVKKQFNKISVLESEFNKIEYQRIISLRDVRLSEYTGIESSMILLSLLSTVFISVYISTGFKKIYNTTTKMAVGVTGVVYIVLFMISMFMGLA